MAKLEISRRDKSLLDLLAQGLPNKVIARKLGYRHGTTRVYLHGLYRKLGVAGKTAAVVWYIGHRQAAAAREAGLALAQGFAPDESIGDMALRTDLYTALGGMSLLLGPYGKVWQVAARLKGMADDPVLDARRRRSRSLWEAFLRGEFAQAKAVFDGDSSLRMFADAPSDGTLLALSLALGGHSRAARRMSAQLAGARRGAQRAAARDLQLIEAASVAIGSGKTDALERIHRLAVDAPAHSPARHMAMAALFHAYKARSDVARAKRTAEALWAEAEASRQHLHAMGEHPLYREGSLPRPGAVDAEASVPRRKEALTAR